MSLHYHKYHCSTIDTAVLLILYHTRTVNTIATAPPPPITKNTLNTINNRNTTINNVGTIVNRTYGIHENLPGTWYIFNHFY